MQVYKIDNQGFYLEPTIIKKGPDGKLPQLTPDGYKIVVIKPKDGLYKAKFTTTGWIEGETEEEALSRLMMGSIYPSDKDLEKAVMELEILQTLIEMGIL